MSKPQVGGLRTTRTAESSVAVESALPGKKEGVFQFRSRAASLRLSLRRRRIERGPEGEREEVPPYCRCKDPVHGDNVALDMVVFSDNYFETPCPELAQAIAKKASETGSYGVGREVWSLEDQKKANDEALERELRARIEANPEIAARVLRPSDKADFELPPAVA